MRKSPFVTGDGQLVEVSDVHFNQELGAPQVFGVLRFEHTSDALRGLVRDVRDQARSQGRPWTDVCDLSGRSGHSRIGIDVMLTDDDPVIDDGAKRMEMRVVVTALNAMLAESLSDLRLLAEREPVDMGRLFIPLSEPLSRPEVLQALESCRLLLPERHAIDEHGVIELPLDNARYVLSPRLMAIGHNFAEMLTKGKHGLSLFQTSSPGGLPALMQPREFLVSAVRIALGPYTAFIDRKVRDSQVMHLASRLLDGIRTTGMGVPRHVELYNRGDEPVPTDELRVRIRLYPAEERVADLAERVLARNGAKCILERGVDFAELTEIFEPLRCESLLDEISPGPGQGGAYARLLMPGRVVNIPWEHEESRLLPEFQWRLVYESVRGNTLEGSLTDAEIPRRFRPFLDELKFVGGDQNLSKVFVADALPPVDTLRVLKRNGIGVVVVRSLGPRHDDGRVDHYLDQSTYEELVNLAREGVRLYLLFGDGASAQSQKQVREFHDGFWVTAQGKERLGQVHTTMAVFGSSVEALRDEMAARFGTFLRALRDDTPLCDGFAVAHGSGPGIMQAVDDAAKELGVFRLGVGIDGEAIGQTPNLAPEALVQFKALAMNTRQDILDRRSIFKIFNIGGFGTSYEINMALTFLKIGHCLPAPYIFVDPLGLGENGEHLWRSTMRQMGAFAAPHQPEGLSVAPLGPAWIARCCKAVETYDQGLAIIKAFVEDPAAFWNKAGVPAGAAARARDNLRAAGIVIPPYIDAALNGS